MVIEHLRVNHIENPIGFYMPSLSLSWIVTQAKGDRAQKARVIIALDEELNHVVSDSGEQEDISSLDYNPNLELQEGTRYYWQVQVCDDEGDSGVSETAFFETGKKLTKGTWIKAPFKKNVQPLFRKRISLEKRPASARLYICGLGVYEAFINGKRISDEYLAPYYNDYNLWLQIQTYDVTDNLSKGENCIGVMLGNGWYKGRFGFVDKMDKLYGDTCHMICELHVTFEDLSEVVIPSDESWLCAPSPVLESSIYDGEVYDSQKEIPDWSKVKCDEKDFVKAKKFKENSDLLMPRLSLPVKVIKKISPKKIIDTPAGEKIIDFGQEITGWVEFLCEEKKGKEITFWFGEILQDKNFYNENLRTAKQEFHYISNGEKRKVRPHFTFYGFRYMKVEGIKDIKLKNFKGCVLHSEMEQTGNIETSNKKVNRLFLNALWGQRGNFLDVPTDCPQRDERMGWTGDAQVFCRTASYNMYTPAFYRKFLYDMKLEQDELEGSVPHVVPDILGQIGVILYGKDDTEHKKAHGACAWADAGAIIPWTMYDMYGDKSLLEMQYGNMKAWADYIRKIDIEKCGDSYLWTYGDHFADWLALDNYHKDERFGATDQYFVASAYYYYSVSLTAKAASILGKKKDEKHYKNLAEHIKKAFIDEYYTKTGRLAQETQTALAIVLWLDLIPEGARQRQIDTLMKKLEAEKQHLTTGFVGTPILCPVLTDIGHPEAAYTLLLNEDYPGWLYEVNMGATTIWERWNSVLPDGKISDTGMNSLNHYAYGSIVEWMYRYMGGIEPCEDAPGFKHFRIRPYTDSRISSAKVEFASPMGKITSAWEKTSEGYLYTIEIPFDTKAVFEMTKDASMVEVNGEISHVKQSGEQIELTKGTYQINVSL
jgi:alpha-L-rhamnosidase